MTLVMSIIAILLTSGMGALLFGLYAIQIIEMYTSVKDADHVIKFGAWMGFCVGLVLGLIIIFRQ